jgi:RNA polymerase sigma-70 factor (ECF subfamily)
VDNPITPDPFPSTAWSCIRRAQNPDDPQFRASATRLATDYWRPVFCYLRAKGYGASDAEDLTQEFFARLWSGRLGLRADPGEGRFRNYLRVVVKHFAIDRTKRARVQEQFERGLPKLSALIREEDRTYEPAAGETPEEAFDRQWRGDLLAAVRRNLAAHYQGTGDPDDAIRYEIFAAYHFAERESERPTQEHLEARFQKGRGFVQSALDHVKKRYERLLRQEVRDQVGIEDEIEAELRRLA